MSVLLKGSPFPQVTSKELAEQIQAKKKSQFKLPSWFNTDHIHYPNKLNIEQCSSETTAAYKASLVSGITLLDGTGGFGVDTFAFSKKMESVTHCEIDKELSRIAAYNFSTLGVTNISCIPIDGIQYLQESKVPFDWMYLDPSRRGSQNRRVFQLTDCTPDVLAHLEFLMQKSKYIMIKTAPFLDLSLGLDQLRFTKEVHIVAVNNEVKELLWILHKNKGEQVRIQTMNINPNKGNESFGFNKNEEVLAKIKHGVPMQYLYEPNAALLKSGGFKIIAQRFPVYKLHEHTHLYTSNELIEFPGRVFQIDQVLEYSKKNMKALKLTKANITTRNFPKTVAEIRKQFRIKDGGDHYLFMAKNHKDDLMVMVCSKLQGTALT